MLILLFEDLIVLIYFISNYSKLMLANDMTTIFRKNQHSVTTVHRVYFLTRTT